jgi:hypothetical protein
MESMKHDVSSNVVIDDESLSNCAANCFLLRGVVWLLEEGVLSSMTGFSMAINCTAIWTPATPVSTYDQELH